MKWTQDDTRELLTLKGESKKAQAIITQLTPVLYCWYCSFGENKNFANGTADSFLQAKEDCEAFGFSFVVIEQDISPIVLFHGDAFYDGVRHLYASSDQESNEIDNHTNAYLFYPNTKMLSAVFTVLRTLEEKYCNTSLLED